jgi:lipopolysaccharide export system permease protein
MLFDSSVRTELAQAFGATAVVILTIVLTMFLIRTVGQAATGAVAPQDVVLLLGFVALGHLPTVLTLSLFVAIVLTLGRLYRDSEMAVWFASGISLVRFAKPVLQTSAPVLLIVGLLLLFAWPWGNRNGIELRERYQQRSDLSRVTPGVFQSSSDGRRVFFIERDAQDETQARNVFILQSDDRGEIVTTARGGRIEAEGQQRFLVLEAGQRNEAGADGTRTLARFEQYRVLVSEGAARSATARSPRTVDTLDLIRQPTARHQGELVWRLGLLCAAGNLTLLGLGLAATSPRRASNWNLLFALLSFLVYYNLVNLTQAWVASGRLGLGTALLGLHGGIFVLALLLLWWRDHEAVAPWRAWIRGGKGRGGRGQGAAAAV